MDPPESSGPVRTPRAQIPAGKFISSDGSSACRRGGQSRTAAVQSTTTAGADRESGCVPLMSDLPALWACATECRLIAQSSTHSTRSKDSYPNEPCPRLFWVDLTALKGRLGS